MLGERRAVVAMQPRETSTNVAIIYDGTESVRYVSLRHLRLVQDGKVLEDVPPYNGELPGDKPRPPAAAPLTFTELCTEMNVTPVERKALATCLAVLRATATLELAHP